MPLLRGRFDGMLKADEEFFKLHGEPLFSSHMLDLSEEPDNENIEICKQSPALMVAHRMAVCSCCCRALRNICLYKVKRLRSALTTKIDVKLRHRYFTRMKKINQILEMEIGVTGGVEDGVNNEGVSNDKLYTTPETVFSVHEKLSPPTPSGARI